MNKIFDASGNPITRPTTTQDRVKKIFKSGHKAILWVIGAIALLAGLITNSEKILNAVWSKSNQSTTETVSVPDLAVKLRNTGDVEIMLLARGEYWLWPSGQGVQHYSGAYEFKQTDNVDVKSQVISIPAKGERKFLIHLTNPALSDFLATGDYNIDFMMRTNQNGRNIVWSGLIPFTKKAMLDAYLFDVYENPNAENK